MDEMMPLGEFADFDLRAQSRMAPNGYRRDPQ